MVATISKIEEIKRSGAERYKKLVLRHIELDAAKEREKTVQEYALRKMGLWKDEMENSAVYTLDSLVFEMDENLFSDCYCPLISEGYKVCFGFEYQNDYNPMYSEYEKPFWDAEKAFLMLAPEFIRLNGPAFQKDADALEKAIGGYMRNEQRNKLISLNCQFLGLPVPDFYK